MIYSGSGLDWNCFPQKQSKDRLSESIQGQGWCRLAPSSTAYRQLSAKALLLPWPVLAPEEHPHFHKRHPLEISRVCGCLLSQSQNQKQTKAITMFEPHLFVTFPSPENCKSTTGNIGGMEKTVAFGMNWIVGGKRSHHLITGMYF